MNEGGGGGGGGGAPAESKRKTRTWGIIFYFIINIYFYNIF